MKTEPERKTKTLSDREPENAERNVTTEPERKMLKGFDYKAEGDTER